MKGQLKIEFVLGLVVFAIIILYVGTQIGTAFNTANTDSRLDALKSQGIAVIDVLTKDHVYGFSELEPNILNITRINEWNAESSSSVPPGRCSGLDKFGMKNYRLTVNKTTSQILYCGYAGISNVRTSVIRYVTIQGDYGQVELELW